jgi:hypothetical protein
MLRFALLLVAVLTLRAQRPSAVAPDEAKFKFERIVQQIHVGMSFTDVFRLLPRSERLPGEPYELSVPIWLSGRVISYQLDSHYTLKVTFGGADHRVSAPAFLQYSLPTTK